MEPSQDQIQFMENWNRLQKEKRRGGRSATSIKLLRPFAEFERTRYLLTSAEFKYDSLNVKKAIAENLPEGVSLIVLAGSDDEKERADRELKGLVREPSRYQSLVIEGSVGFWARDSLPIPVFSSFPLAFNLVLTNARYYHGYEPDIEVSKKFQAGHHQHSYFYEGGNFIADDRGNCFLVENGRTNQIGDDVFSEFYGCASLTRLPFVAGIGHIDERVKILSSYDVVTDTPSYVETFEKKGYRVKLLPNLGDSFETYANALLVNGTVFLPIFKRDTDQEAIELYKTYQLKVVPIVVDKLPNSGKGSIHCITMTYPDLPKEILFDH